MSIFTRFSQQTYFYQIRANDLWLCQEACKDKGLANRMPFGSVSSRFSQQTTFHQNASICDGVLCQWSVTLSRGVQGQMGGMRQRLVKALQNPFTAKKRRWNSFIIQHCQALHIVSRSLHSTVANSKAKLIQILIFFIVYLRASTCNSENPQGKQKLCFVPTTATSRQAKLPVFCLQVT